MNNTKLHTTHKHLTLVFTWVVFLIVIILAGTFLWARYYNDSRHEKNEFLSQVHSLVMKGNSDISFLQKIQRVRELDEKQKFWEEKWRWDIWNVIPISFFILDEDKNVIFENIMKEPEFNTLDFQKKNYYIDANTYIALRDFWENTIIFYQDIRYSLRDVFSDFLLLLILASVSGVLFYFIWYRFVEKALSPVEANLQDMTDFVHNAGHELKTPLAVMHGNLQVMQIEEKFDKKLLKKSLWEINRANSLIEWLIELSEIGKLSEKSSLALATQVKKTVDELSDFAQEKNIQINNHVEWKYIVQANVQELNILLVNILKNAIKYNTKWWSVNISLEKNILSISDSGKWISSQDKEKIFDRFYRGSKVRSEEWFGIGLSLVKKITDTNNWKIEIESEEWKWSEFKIIF